MTFPSLTIRPLRLPASLDAPDASDFLRVVELGRQACAEEIGMPELSLSAAELLPRWQEQTDQVMSGRVAVVGDRIVGSVTMEHPTADDAHTLDIELCVPEAEWGRGVEDALLAAAEADARRGGLRIAQIWTLHRPGSGARMLTPASGHGQVQSTPMSDLLEREGYRLGQVERTSAFDLQQDLAPVRARLDAAVRFAGPDYRIVPWTLPTPPELRRGYADLRARMDTDIPAGDLEVFVDAWDADRIERRDRATIAGGQVLSVVAVEHVPTGDLVAFNELMIGPDRTAATHQLATLVRDDHRGHRLGTVVKCAGLLAWHDRVPTSPRVLTFNAEENRPMLDVNEAVGFVAVAAAAGWQKHLD